MRTQNCSSANVRPAAYLQHVLHFDDAALQDGRTYRWDFDGATVPGFPTFGTDDVTAKRGHDGALLLHGAAGDERLRLNDKSFGDNRSGGRVVELGKDRYHLACGERKSTLRKMRHYKSLSTWEKQNVRTWCVAFAVNLCSYRHLPKAAVPRPRHFILRTRLWCLEIIKTSEQIP